MKLRLFIWTCIVLAFILAAYLLSDWFALTLYHYIFCISPSTSFGKMTVLLLWLLCSYIIAYVSVRCKWGPFNFRRLFIIFLILATVLISINVFVWFSMFDKAGGNELAVEGRPMLFGSRPEAIISYSSSTLGHTHSLKPVLYWLFSPFAETDSMHFDIGGALYPLFPSPGIVCPIVIILTVAYLAMSVMILMHTANKEKKSCVAWFTCLVFSFTSFLLFETAYDGGPFSTTALTGVALLSLYLLMRYTSRKHGKKWILPLMFLPLIILAYLDMITYNLAPWGISLYEHFLVSTLCIAGAGVYEFSQGKSSGQRRGVDRSPISKFILSLIILLLLVNLLSFRPSHVLNEAREGDDVYMTISIDPSTTDNEILERLGNVQDLVYPEIIARDGRTVMAMAGVKRAGITSMDLAHQIVGDRVSPLAANIMFEFGNPSIERSLYVYLPIDEVELRQALPSNHILQIDSTTEIDGGLTRVDYTAPIGLNSDHYLVLLLGQEGLRLTHWIYYSSFDETSATDRVANFISISLPLTYLKELVD